MTGAAPAERWFLGVRITLLDLEAAAALLAGRDAAEPFAYVVTPNAQHMVSLDRDIAPWRAVYDGAWLRLCDSQVARLLAKVLFGESLPHAAGSDLTARLFGGVIGPDDAITVIGGDAEMTRRLRDRFGLTRLALHQPPMGLARDPSAQQACIDFVRAHPARFVFLAVGAPQSELLALRLAQGEGATGIGLCVGSSLNFVTGIVPRAPKWMRALALEWLFRLLRDPRGHARRVFIDSLPLVGLALRARLRPAATRHLPR